MTIAQRLLISCFIITLCFGSMTAFQFSTLDSLEAVLLQTTGKTERVDLLNDISFGYWNVDPQKTDSLARVSLELSRKIGYERGIASAYYRIGVGKWMQGVHDEAFEAITKSLQIYESIERPVGAKSCLAMMALIMEEQGNYAQAIKYHKQCMDFEESQNDTLGLAHSYNNIAAVYYRQQKLDTALQYYLQSLSMRENAGSQRGIRESCANLSVVYRELGDLDLALSFANRTRSISYELENAIDILNAELIYADVLSDLGKLDSAQTIYLRLLAEAQDLSIPKRSMEILTGLRRVSERNGNFRDALNYSDKYHELQDSVLDIETAERVARLEAQYQSQRKEKEIADLQLQSRNRRLWRNIFAVGVLASLLFVLLLFLSFRFRSQRKEAQLRSEALERKHLEDVNKLQSRFFANISHEFRTPLTLIQGPVEQLIDKLELEEDRKLLQVVKKNAARLLLLINQLLELSRFEAGQVQLNATLQDVIPHLRGWTMLFEGAAARKHINLSFQSDEESVYIYFNADKLQQAITNLISNAVKFTGEGGTIAVTISKVILKEREFISIKVHDDGVGIPKEMQAHIFDRFYQAHSTEQGSSTGIGLSLVREYVQLHGGKIKLQSNVEQGSTFTILLPLGKDHLTDDQIIPIMPSSSHLSHHQLKESPIQEAITRNLINEEGKDELILLVEDNSDLQMYLEQILAQDYRTLKAGDGRQGIDLAIEHTPDIIISDIMMPAVDGIELCQKLKDDVRTSHVPIILLTAKSQEEDRFLGLESLADAYITKPFNATELLLTISNLLANRLKLHDHYNLESLIHPKPVEVDSMERRFLMDLSNHLESHISDELFGVEQLAESMSMSRSQLHRKLKAIANISPSHFIRSFRLERAKELLDARSGSVTEIAYQVGFSNPSYFSKCFQEQFGVLPGKILKDSTS